MILPPSLLDEQPEGIFIAGELSVAYTSALIKTGIPIISIDFCRPDLATDSVVVDNYYGGYCAAMHLVEHGPTAFVCHCDMAAYHLLVKLQNHGVAEPRRIVLNTALLQRDSVRQVSSSFT